MAEVDGATLIARSLKKQGIDHLFGVVGFPVGPIAAAAQKEGVAYIGMRNEQAASYAAQAYGYLKGRPGACIVVTGPGVVHGLAGLANAQQNCWPMILIGGASETYRGAMGAFQEERQVLIASPFCKFAHAIDTVQRIPYYVEMATRNAIYGRPGATYLDVPDDFVDVAFAGDDVVGHVEIGSAGAAIDRVPGCHLDIIGDALDALDAVREFGERRGGQHLALFLKSAHAAAIGLRGAAEQDHWPAILLGIGEAGETVHHAWAGPDEDGAGAAGQV